MCHAVLTEMYKIVWNAIFILGPAFSHQTYASELIYRKN
jgi:hypothetical protein